MEKHNLIHSALERLYLYFCSLVVLFATSLTAHYFLYIGNKAALAVRKFYRKSGSPERFGFQLKNLFFTPDLNLRAPVRHSFRQLAAPDMIHSNTF